MLRNDPSFLNIKPGTYDQWKLQTLKGRFYNEQPEKDIYFGNDTIDICEFEGQLTFKQSERNNAETTLLQDKCANKLISRSFD